MTREELEQKAARFLAQKCVTERSDGELIRSAPNVSDVTAEFIAIWNAAVEAAKLRACDWIYVEDVEGACIDMDGCKVKP